MATVHVLTGEQGEQGEYSGHQVWVVAVYQDQASARAEAERLEGLWRQWHQRCDEDEDYRYSDQAKEDVQAIDSNLDDFPSSYQPTYHVEEVEVR